MGDVAVAAVFTLSFVFGNALCATVGLLGFTSPLGRAFTVAVMLVAWLPSGYFFLVGVDRLRSRRGGGVQV